MSIWRLLLGWLIHFARYVKQLNQDTTSLLWIEYIVRLHEFIKSDLIFGGTSRRFNYLQSFFLALMYMIIKCHHSYLLHTLFRTLAIDEQLPVLSHLLQLLPQSLTHSPPYPWAPWHWVTSGNGWNLSLQNRTPLQEQVASLVAFCLCRRAVLLQEIQHEFFI